MKLTTNFVDLIIEDNILIVTYKPGIRINQEVAEKIVGSRLSYTGSKQIPCMILSQGVVSMDKPAREYLASPAATEGLLATAIIVDSHFSRFLGNFFHKVYKTQMPVKIFSSIPQAKKWLQQFFV
jgi:hypothetical protein